MGILNVNSPFGFVPVKSGGKTNVYKAIAANPNIFVGSPIRMTSTGEVTVGIAGDVLIGISASFLEANTGGTIMVLDDPDEEFVVKANGILEQTHIGNLINQTAESGNATTKVSTCAINTATVGTLNTLQFLIKGRSAEVGNDFGNFANMIVKINLHQWTRPAAGV